MLNARNRAGSISERDSPASWTHQPYRQPTSTTWWRGRIHMQPRRHHSHFTRRFPIAGLAQDVAQVPIINRKHGAAEAYIFDISEATPTDSKYYHGTTAIEKSFSALFGKPSLTLYHGVRERTPTTTRLPNFIGKYRVTQFSRTMQHKASKDGGRLPGEPSALERKAGGRKRAIRNTYGGCILEQVTTCGQGAAWHGGLQRKVLRRSNIGGAVMALPQAVWSTHAAQS
jgi:hypothetical protein